MAGASAYLQDRILDHVLGTTAYAFPATVYVGLTTADPDDGTFNEVSGGSYARQAADFDAASGGVADNTADITFTAMPACTVTHFGVWDSDVEGAGNLLLSDEITGSPRVFEAGEDAIFRAGALDVACV